MSDSRFPAHRRPAHRRPSRRPSLRGTVAVAAAAAGIVAVTTSSAVSMADGSAPSRITMMAEQQPSTTTSAAATTEAPTTEAPAPAIAAPIAEVMTPVAEAVAPLAPPVAEIVAAPISYGNNLDGWIREALDIMRANNIPGSYEAIHRNIMRESTGNPQAINLWDSNAAAGTPSKGLLQVIEPTFNAYHVPGTSWDIFDPVANIAAACNYAASRYGSMDNVYGAY
ncbi:transglycosylase SLT domain-containing protein [Nocardia sp. 004]|uniref:transglycosylase SLT domain-containing protein n=1 Tax=Nocardia sp. 004 TaxID=3385978 RepID=UPI0039A3AEC7